MLALFLFNGPPAPSDAEIDDWSDRELIPRLVMVVSLGKAHEEEEIPDDGGV